MGELTTPMDAVIALAEHDGVLPINQFEGCWVRRIDEHWWVASNAHKFNIRVEPEGCMLVDAKPFTTYVWFNGWLAGWFRPYQDEKGEVAVAGEMADGAVANMETFLEAVRVAVEVRGG